MIPDKVFYLDPDNLNMGIFKLDKFESHHANNVFRLRPTQKIFLINGLGTAYIAEILNIKGGIIYGRIDETLVEYGENAFNLNVAISITKRDSFERSLKCMTELGVMNIYPIATSNSIRKTVNKERCKEILKSSSKQCIRSRIPRFHKPKSFLSWLAIKSKEQNYAGILGSKSYLSEFYFDMNKEINIIIGPEGDFDKNEINELKKSGTNFFTLGKRRLRSDTAVNTSLSIFNELASKL